MLLLLLGAYLLRVPLLVGAARALVVDDPPARSDLVFLLGGDARFAVRATHAAALFRRGVAPRVVLARVEDTRATELGLYPNETDVNRGILRRAGVPDSAVVELRRPGGVASTTDEAVELRRYLERHPARRVVVVTTRYHTRRARWNLRRQLEGVPVELRMAGAVDPRFDERSWWRTEEGLLAHVEEYLKFVHNWLYR